MRSLGHLTISLVLMLLAVACRNIRAATAHYIGCNEADVRISDDNVGFDARTWKAYCNNQTYDCQSVDDESGTLLRCVPVGLDETSAPAPPAGAGAPSPGTEAHAPTTPATPEGCQYDTQCKGDRLCRDGECVDPVTPGPGLGPAEAPDGADEADENEDDDGA